MLDGKVTIVACYRAGCVVIGDNTIRRPCLHVVRHMGVCVDAEVPICSVQDKRARNVLVALP